MTEIVTFQTAHGTPFTGTVTKRLTANDGPTLVRVTNESGRTRWFFEDEQVTS